jgi:hypothetical protein
MKSVNEMEVHGQMGNESYRDAASSVADMGMKVNLC